MRARFLLIPLLGLCCLGMGKKQTGAIIRFYTQTSSQDTDSFATQVTLLNGQPTYIDQVANISERDIVAVYPFATPDGTGGCTFKLDAHGTIALDTLSLTKRGTQLIETINGRQIFDVLIDQHITDGVVSIPNGITTDEMKQILKKFPVWGNPKQKPKKKDIYSVGL
jgi:hypothetical protein